MVRNYVRKTEDRWNKEDLLEALVQLNNNTLKIMDASRLYGISRATLYRQYKKFIDRGAVRDANQFSSCGGNAILTRVEEDVLEKTIEELRGKGFQVNSGDIKRICFEYCVTNQIPNQFNKFKRLASDDWYYGFLKRHPGVKIQTKTTIIGGAIEAALSQPNSFATESVADQKTETATSKFAPNKKPLKRLTGTGRGKSGQLQGRKAIETVTLPALNIDEEQLRQLLETIKTEGDEDGNQEQQQGNDATTTENQNKGEGQIGTKEQMKKPELGNGGGCKNQAGVVESAEDDGIDKESDVDSDIEYESEESDEEENDENEIEEDGSEVDEEEDENEIEEDGSEVDEEEDEKSEVGEEEDESEMDEEDDKSEVDEEEDKSEMDEEEDKSEEDDEQGQEDGSEMEEQEDGDAIEEDENKMDEDEEGENETEKERNDVTMEEDEESRE